MKLLQNVHITCLALVLIPCQAYAGLASSLEKNITAHTALQAQTDLSEKELLTLLLSAEIALQRHLPKQALEKYLLAAQLTQDPKIAKRATELAVDLQQAQTAKITSQIWANQAQEDLQAQMVAITLLIGSSIAQAKPYLERVFENNHPDLDQYFVGILLKLSPHSKMQLTQALNEMAQQKSQHKMVLLTAAQASALSGHVQQAKKWVAKLLKTDPSQTTALQLQAKIIRFETRSDQKALDFLASKLKTYPKNAKLRSFYVNALLDNEQVQEAMAQLKLLSQDQTFRSDALLSLSQIYIQNDQFHSAEQILQDLEKEPSNQQTARFLLGKLFEKKQHYPKAIQSYRSVNHGTYHVLAQLQAAELMSLLLFQHKKALDILKNTQAQTLSDQKKIVLSRIYILKRDNRPEQAMEIASHFLKILPGDLDLLYARAMIASILKQLHVVEQDLQIVLTLNPNHANALNILGFTLANQTNRFDEARAYLNRAIELHANHPAYLDSLGWLEYRQGNLEQALIHLKKAASLTDNPVVATHLGEVLWASKKPQQAQNIWQKVIEKHPTHALLLETLKRLNVVLKPKTVGLN